MRDNENDPSFSGRGDIAQRKKRPIASFNYFSELPIGCDNIISYFKDQSSGIVLNSSEANGSDVFMALQQLLGFQMSNVSNQREHLILLLANVSLRKEPGNELNNALESLHRRTFSNYQRWCHHLKTPPVFPGGVNKMGLHLALYFLIWGEAANLRFMPECICFLYFKAALAIEMYMENPSELKSHFQAEGAYLNEVIYPIYAEAAKMKHQTGDHATIRNYDDLNEFFWAKKCLKLQVGDHLGKTLSMQEIKTFREKRSLFNPFLAFFRIFFFLIVMLHLMIAIAYVSYRTNPSNSSGFHYYENFFAKEFADLRKQSICSLQLTISWLLFFKTVLEIWMDDIMLFTGMRAAWAQLVRCMWHLLFFGLALAVVISPNEIIFGTSSTFLNMSVMFFSVYLISIVVPSIMNIWFKEKLFRSKLLAPYYRTYASEYLGRECDSAPDLYMKYAAFWIVVFLSKFLFNLQLMIIPLVGPSVEIYEFTVTGESVTGPFESRQNGLLILAIWAPVLCVYIYDTQIWFTLFQALVGLIQGLRLKVGTSTRISVLMAELRHAPHRFSRTVASRLATNQALPPGSAPTAVASLRFAVVWNECVNSFRSGDLIDDRESAILQYMIDDGGTVRDPVFLLAGHVARATAKATAINSKSKTASTKLIKALMADGLVPCISVTVHLLERVLGTLLGPEDAAVMDTLLSFTTKGHYARITTLFKVERLGDVKRTLVTLLGALLDLPEPTILVTMEGDPMDEDEEGLLRHDASEVMVVVQAMEEFLMTICEAMKEPHQQEVIRTCQFLRHTESFVHQAVSIAVFYENTEIMNDTTQLILLLTLDVADALPQCPEAQRRIGFFLNSLGMTMPQIASIRSMASFSVLTPYYSETVMFSMAELEKPVNSNPLFKAVEDSSRGDLTILKYLVTCHPVEWLNFLERIGTPTLEDALVIHSTDVRLWASHRGQTLSRTVSGMMLYDDAIRMLRWLEVGSDPMIAHDDKMREMEEITKLKFSYITSCQLYGQHDAADDDRAADINFLLRKYPNWRVSFVDRISIPNGIERCDAVLIKASGDEIQEVYRIVLPGDPILGEGKPENQNIALPFSRGEFLQTIDMNQEHYFEEALKMPNFLATATPGTASAHPVTIIGMKEHIFTGQASSLARFMTLQELVFVTLTQRVLAKPLESRMHYGHPDVFDKVFVMTNGGVSKGSRGINLSEDVFAGFNVMLRGGRVTHQEFMIVGKGRDLALSQINQFEAKLATGSAECSISREAFRLGKHVDFFRLHSVYYGHMGFYICNLLTVACVFIYAYSKVYVALHMSTTIPQLVENSTNFDDLATVLNTQFIFQFGMLMTIPLFATLVTEESFLPGVFHMLELILTLGPVFYVFETGTKSHYFDMALLRGGSKYRGTGRGFIVSREMFVTFFKEYAESHYHKALELVALMVIFALYGNFRIGQDALQEYCRENDIATEDCASTVVPDAVSNVASYGFSGQSYGVQTFAVWFLAITWLLAPFLFNTDGLDSKKTKVDAVCWLKWMFTREAASSTRATHVVSESKREGWYGWWTTQTMTNGFAAVTLETRIWLLIRESRHFILMAYIFLVDFNRNDFPILVGAIATLVLLLSVVDAICARQGAAHSVSVGPALVYFVSVMLILAGAVLFLVLFEVVIVGTPSTRQVLSWMISILAGSYGLLQVALSLNNTSYFQVSGWRLVSSLAFFFDFLTGGLLLLPLLGLSFLPFISILQTRMLYNGGFSRALSTSGQYAASLSIVTGITGGFAYGWYTVLLFSLGTVNEPTDGYRNLSFENYINASDLKEGFDYDGLSFLLALASVGGIAMGGLMNNYVGRLPTLVLTSLVSLGGIALLFSTTTLVFGLLMVSGAMAALALTVMQYNYEITTSEFKGKGVNVFLFGAALGYLVEAAIIASDGEPDIEGPASTTWRFQFIYGAIPLLVLLPLAIYLPESPNVWLQHKTTTGLHEKRAEAILMKLRQKFDVADELKTLCDAYYGPVSPFHSTLLPRIILLVLIQATFALATSNALLAREKNRNSQWHVYYGVMFLIGISIGLFTVDQIRRKTILKDILPAAALLAIVIGVLNELESTKAEIKVLLFVLYVTLGLGLGTAGWLTAFELFPPRHLGLYTPLSFMVYYATQAAIYRTGGVSLTVSMFVFGFLALSITGFLLFFWASTPDGAIRLKREKAQERADTQVFDMDEQSRSHTLRVRSRVSRRQSNRFLDRDTIAEHGTSMHGNGNGKSFLGNHYDQHTSPVGSLSTSFSSDAKFKTP